MTHPEAVEAVAKALYEVDAMTTDQWTAAHPDVQDAYRQDATAAVDALVAAGWAPRWEVAPPHEHLIYLRADFNWELHRHEACKDDTEHCPVTVAVREADSFPDYAPGDYVCGINADGELELRPVVPRVTERQNVAEEIARAIETDLADPPACAWTRTEAAAIARDHGEATT